MDLAVKYVKNFFLFAALIFPKKGLFEDANVSMCTLQKSIWINQIFLFKVVYGVHVCFLSMRITLHVTIAMHF